MKHIKMTADILLGIVQGIFNSSDFEIETDEEKTTAMQKLNFEFYSFKRRVKSASDYLESMEKSLNHAYCLCELTSAQRLYSRDIDHLTIEGRLTAWLQTKKIKLFETLIEECNMAYCGEVCEIEIGEYKRSMLVEFSVVQPQGVQSTSEIGEAAILSVAVKMELAPSISSYDDYKIELSFDGGASYLIAPYTSWTYVYNASQVALPLANQSDSGFINVSRSNSISITLYEFNEPLTRELRAIALRCNTEEQAAEELNKTVYMRITLGTGETAETFTYKVLPKTITINSMNTTFNTMAVVFAPRGGL
ncbi:MAG: hypothetical protein NC184_05705 [Roseburia sp.]|nr:hypothetical protein [Ruminococcus flavefaciens]MCM1368283.1 hypothetical protein [Roseburia sp.]